jgi:hypothetical protein
MNTVKTNFSVLQTLRRQVGEIETHRAQVGLFADNAGRSADENRIAHNPSLGFVHEFGDIKHNIPERSFIRMPLWSKLGDLITMQGTNWLYIMRTRGVKRMLAHLGAMAEDLIQEAFSTRGFGQWPELKRETIRRKGSSAILIESAQMRKAVAYRVI